jgi:hypothetical protein
VLSRRWPIGLLLIVGVIAPAFAQDKPVNLTWKFEKDKTFYQEMTTETDQTIKVMGSDVVQKQKQTFFMSWTPKEQDKDKNWIVSQKIEGVRMDIDIGGNKINYDSTKPDAGASNTLADFFKALIGSEFKLTISPDMKVLKVEGRDDVIKKLGAQNPQVKGLLEQILSEEALKQMTDPLFAAIPGKEVKKGDTWEKKSKIVMGPIGSYDTAYKFTYDGPDTAKDSKLEKVKVEITMKYEAPVDNPAVPSALPFKIKNPDLKSSNATGTILINRELGRVESSEMSMELKGKLSIEIGGMTSDVELAQKQKTSTKTTTENPIPKK